MSFGIILVALGLFAQAAALLSSLVLIRRNSGNWRLDTFLCQIAGIAAGFVYYSLWSSIEAFERTGTRTPAWAARTRIARASSCGTWPCLFDTP
jgi:uncharacterized protein HemY